MLRPFFEGNELKHLVFKEIFYFWKFDCFHVYMKTFYRYKQRLDEMAKKLIKILGQLRLFLLTFGLGRALGKNEVS